MASWPDSNVLDGPNSLVGKAPNIKAHIADRSHTVQGLQTSASWAVVQVEVPAMLSLHRA